MMALMVTTSAICQTEYNLIASAKPLPGRATVIKEFLEVPGMSEKIFWPIYSEYEFAQQKVFDGLHVLESMVGDKDSHISISGHNEIKKYIKIQYDEVATKHRYFSTIAQDVNGSLAYQFVQTETIFDLMDRADFYRLHNFSPLASYIGFLNDSLKWNYMISYLSISTEQSEKLKPVYDLFEFEYSRVVGEQFVWFGQYTDDVSLLTPGQAKLMGESLLRMLKAEITVKEKFFWLIEDIIGSDSAAQYFLMEDYVSVRNKLQVWADCLAIL